MHVLNTAPRPVARTQALSVDAELYKLPVLGLDLVAEHEQATSEMLALLDRTPSTLQGRRDIPVLAPVRTCTSGGP